MVQSAARQLAHRCPVAFTQGSRKVHVQVPSLKDRELFRPLRTSEKIQLANKMGLLKCSASSNGATHGTLQYASHLYRRPILDYVTVQKERTQHSVEFDISQMIGVRPRRDRRRCYVPCVVQSRRQIRRTRQTFSTRLMRSSSTVMVSFLSDAMMCILQPSHEAFSQTFIQSHITMMIALQV